MVAGRGGRFDRVGEHGHHAGVGESQLASERHALEKLGHGRLPVTLREGEHAGDVVRHQNPRVLAVLAPPRPHLGDRVPDAPLVGAEVGMDEAIGVAEPHGHRGVAGIERRLQPVVDELGRHRQPAGGDLHERHVHGPERALELDARTGRHRPATR